MTRVAQIITLCALSFGAALAPESAKAEAPVAEPEPITPAEAAVRQSFEEAVTLLANDRFAEARDLLRSILPDAPHAWVAFNLAKALRGTGEVRAAVELLEGILNGEYGRFEGEWGEKAERELAEIRGQVARLVVTSCGAEESTLRVDGALVAELRDCETRTIEVDPGRHVLLFDAENAEAVERQIVVGPGESGRVRVDIEVREIFEAPPERRSVLRSGWFWGIAGVVVAGAVVGTVLGLRAREPVCVPSLRREALSAQLATLRASRPSPRQGTATTL